MLEREDFGIDADVTSDCAPLWNTVKAVMDTTHDLHVIRDATRGGVGTVLYEIAGQSNVGIRLNAEAVPVQPEVKGVCGMLGLEPLYLACEGRLVIMASKKEAGAIVETLKNVHIQQMQQSLVKLWKKKLEELSWRQRSVHRHYFHSREESFYLESVK